MRRGDILQEKVTCHRLNRIRVGNADDSADAILKSDRWIER